MENQKLLISEVRRERERQETAKAALVLKRSSKHPSFSDRIKRGKIFDETAKEKNPPGIKL